MSTRSEIPIPDFFIAFVFPDEYTHYTYRDPTADETEELRQQTVKFWTEQLDQVYNDDTKGGEGLCTFEKIDLKIEKTVFGPRAFYKDRRDDLDNRFNTYLELSGKATFLVSSSTKKKPSIPTCNDIFRKMVAGDSMDYLCKYVKSQSTDDEKKNDDNENIYTKAIEVCAKRLQEDPDNQVFVVRSPTFFVALATDPLDEEEAREPTKTETYNLTKRTKDHIQKHIKEDYPNTFMNCHMSLVKTEIGTDKPDDRFKLYYEHEVVATFTADPPTPTELFALIMRISSIGFPEYVTTLRAMDQTPYVAVTMITVQIVGLEMQEAIELEELPPPQEEEEDKSLGSGDEEEQEDDKSEASTPPPQPLKELTTRNVPIFLALVVWTEPPAAMPSRADLQQFEDLMLRYFYTVLKNEYRETLHDMKLERKETRFDAGIPEPRFNVCVEYDATIRFDCDDETAPDNKTLKKIILHVNISTILAHVRKLEPLCFEKCSEVSMRKKPKKQKAEKKKIKDSAFEAAVDLLEPPPIDYEAEKKAEEEAAAKAAEAEKKAKEKAAAKEAARKKAAAKKKALEEQAARVRAEAEAKKKAEEEKIAAEKAAAEAKAAEEAKKKAKEEAAKRAKEEANRKAEEEAAKKKAEEEAAKKKAEEEAAAAKAAEEAAQKKKKKKPKKEKKTAVDKEPVPPGKRAHTAEVYTAFKLRNCEADPSDEDYEKLREKTQKFFTKRLTKEFGSKLSAVRIKIHEKAFGSERPDKTFNVYVEWDIETFYISDDGSQELSVELDRRESIIVDGENGNAPSPEKLIRVLVRDTDVMGYLIKAVQPLKNTPFANVTMGFFGAKVKTKTTY